MTDWAYGVTLLAITAYGLCPMITGQPVSHWIARACDVWACADRALYRAVIPACSMVRHNFREELSRLERRAA